MTREMDRRRETMIFVIAEVVLILVILASLLACQTKKEVSERIIVHDTLMVGHTDTLRITTHTARVDTIRESTTKYVTIRQDTARTDTIRVETIRDRFRYVYVGDSVGMYKAVADSLRSVIEQQERKLQKVTKSKPPLLQYAIVAALIIFVCVVVLKSRE